MIDPFSPHFSPPSKKFLCRQTARRLQEAGANHSSQNRFQFSGCCTEVFARVPTLLPSFFFIALLVAGVCCISGMWLAASCWRGTQTFVWRLRARDETKCLLERPVPVGQPPRLPPSVLVATEKLTWKLFSQPMVYKEDEGFFSLIKKGFQKNPSEVFSPFPKRLGRV